MKSARATVVLLIAAVLLVNTSSIGAQDPCASKPCMNGGLCDYDTPNTYICMCNAPYTGARCESGGSLACFPTNSTIVLESGRHILIQDLAIGDRVLSFDNSGKLFFSEVFMWLDRVAQAKVDLIQLKTETGKTFKATPYHVILVGDTFTQMRNVKIGDELSLTDDETHMYKEKVTGISEIHDGSGAFSPLTNEGTIVVDGVAASCYSYSHVLGQIGLAPMKLLAKLGIVSGKAEGFHWYSKALFDFAGAIGVQEWVMS